MKTIEQVQNDPSRGIFERLAASRALAEAPRPQPAPMSQAEASAARKQTALAALPRHRAALTSLAEALTSHDGKVIDYDSQRPVLQAEVDRALNYVNLINHVELQAFISNRAKLEIVQHFVANGARLRSQICAALEQELKGLAATLAAADKLDHARPPQFMAGHGLESRVALAVSLIDTLLATP